MAVVTRLKAAGRSRIAVELDGDPWRVLPAEAVLAAGISRGIELDRVRARTLRRELRRVEARDAAAAAVSRRDLPRGLLEDRLEARGVAPAERRAAVERLQRAGVVDDERFAHSRAAALAARGRGDAAIRHDLDRQGLDAELVGEALAGLAPESERAVPLARKLGGGRRAAQGLARRGFGEDAVEAALGAIIAETHPAELRYRNPSNILPAYIDVSRNSNYP